MTEAEAVCCRHAMVVSKIANMRRGPVAGVESTTDRMLRWGIGVNEMENGASVKYDAGIVLGYSATSFC